MADTSGPWGDFVETRHPLADIVEAVRLAQPPPGMQTRVVGVDGEGGAGKSTVARRLSSAFPQHALLHTDDIASEELPLDWWPRVLSQVLEPLATGRPARWQRYDWERRELAEWHEIDPGLPVLVLEGVSAMRLAFEPYLTYRIWVHTPPETRLRRGIERDGPEMAEQWDIWIADEDDYVARERPVQRADLIVSGEPALAYDPTSEVVALVPRASD